jgi:hypothetical protein
MIWSLCYKGAPHRARRMEGEAPPRAVSLHTVDSLELDEVAPEDRSLVTDVVSVLSSFKRPNKIVKGYIVCPRATYYEVQAFVDTRNGEWEIGCDDLELLKRLDDNRVRPVTVRASGQSVQIVVGVLKRSERVMLIEHDVIRVRKRQRWLPWG